MIKKNIVIVGASGGIGSALTNLLSEDATHTVYALSRSLKNYDKENVVEFQIDLKSESSFTSLLDSGAIPTQISMVFVTTGMLHDDDIQPEKSLKDINLENMAECFAINTFGPALIAKHFLPRLDASDRGVFAVLSARVGSISDNRLGGWYAYRASKAALNMLIKTASIEISRTNKNAVVVGLHPGTVDTHLSKPFQRNVKASKLFDSVFSAKKLLEVTASLTAKDTGKVFAWDGSEIPS